MMRIAEIPEIEPEDTPISPLESYSPNPANTSAVAPETERTVMKNLPR